MKINIRQALLEDVKPAIDLAYKVFMEFEAPVYTSEAIAKFVDGCINNESYINNYMTGTHKMFIALDSQRIVGVISERGKGRISILFVDRNYHHQGIATALMDKMIEYFKVTGIQTASLESSPYAVTFYHSYGFSNTDKEQCNNGFIFTPMSYGVI